MTTPGFTAEASLDKTRESYFLAPGAPGQSGGVVPQFFQRVGDYLYITYCDDGYCLTTKVKVVNRLF